MFKLIKRSFVAYSWEEYTSQGPEYEEIKLWWENNCKKISPELTPDYNSWTMWYRNAFNNSWNKQHKHPSEVLQILKSEAAKGNTFSQKFRNIYNKYFNSSNSNSTSSTNTDSQNTNILNSNSQNLDEYKKYISWNNGANLEKTSDNIKRFLLDLGILAQKYNHPKPYVTSAFRSIPAQIRAMANNWNRYGGGEMITDQEALKIARFRKETTIKKIRQNTNQKLNKGLVYFCDLYGDTKMAIGLNNIFLNYGTGKEAIAMGVDFWESLGKEKKSHLGDPATAVDLRMTKGIEQLLKEIYSSGKYNMKYLNEENHFHVNIY